jgi:outer membrane protein assembly factor BamA
VLRRFLVSFLLAVPVCAQPARFNLDTVTVEGASMPGDIVLTIAGLHVGDKIDKADIEAACGKLQESGLFESIEYSYKPASDSGYALTLSLIPQSKTSAAAIDIPGADENEIWRWLVSQYPSFDHRVPSAGAAQQFVALRIEEHLGPSLHGKHVVANLETGFARRGGSLISFQPATLPRIASMTFPGAQEIPAPQLEAILRKLIGDRGFTDRSFRALVEMNLRPAYEERGLYRIKFPTITARILDGDSVAVSTAIEEGPKYTLGDVRLSGSDIPTSALLQAADFELGKIANGRRIHDGIAEMERILKRQGFLDAAAEDPKKTFDDAQRVMSLEIPVAKGPLYHFGQVTFVGLSPDLEAKARKTWRAQPGEPFNLLYTTEFMRDFSKQADLRQLKTSSRMKPGTGDHVIDLTLTFESK